MGTERNKEVKISLQQARDVAALAVQERGEDYVDEGMKRYYANGKPSCLVGCILDYLGVDKTQFTSKMIGSSVMNEAKILSVLDVLQIETDGMTRDYLCALQHGNDDDMSWGETVATAELVILGENESFRKHANNYSLMPLEVL